MAERALPQRPIGYLALVIAVVIGLGMPLLWAGQAWAQALPVLLVGAAAGFVLGFVAFVLLPPTPATAVLVVGVLAGALVWNALGGVWSAAFFPWFLFAVGGSVPGAQVRYLRQRGSTPAGGGAEV